MLINFKQKKLKKRDDTSVEEIKAIIDKADRIVIGAGAGLSASAGLDYSSESFFKTHYSSFTKKYKNIAEGIAHNWYLRPETSKSYWGFWSRHIYTVSKAINGLEAYDWLYDIVKDKNYFVITTNADGQFFKTSFEEERVFAMQGQYRNFQCQQLCHETLYDNSDMIEAMLTDFDDQTLEISNKRIPKCPKCGGLLSPNLRIDHLFAEGDLTNEREAYLEFVSARNERIVFLELGVGFNTPVIIRYPFEQMVEMNKKARLIRVNRDAPDIPESIGERGVSTTIDIKQLLKQLNEV